MNYKDILRAEILTAERTRNEMGKWFVKFEQLMDILIKLNYYYSDTESATDETPENCFFAFANGKYLEAPHSIHVCHSLMEKGHYLNAMIQLRSVLDYFVSCRYFHNNLQHITPYRKEERCLIGGKKKWLGTSEIYGFFSKDFYDRYYGNMLSKLSHGKTGTAIYRIDLSNSQEPRIIMVPEFNLNHVALIINHIVPVIYGYLSHWEVLFEERRKQLPSELEEERIEAMGWLKSHFQKQKDTYPESVEWAEGMSKILGIPLDVLVQEK